MGEFFFWVWACPVIPLGVGLLIAIIITILTSKNKGTINNNNPNISLDSSNSGSGRDFSQELEQKALEAQQKEDHYAKYNDLNPDRMSHQEKKDYENLKSRGYDDEDINRMDYKNKHR